MKTILAGILVLVVVANAEKPCEVPMRFAGNLNLLSYNIDAGKVSGVTNMKYYYDANNKRVRIEGEHEGKKYTVIILYEEAKQYVFGEGYCYSMASKGNFKKMSLPSNANLFNGGRIGTASNGLYINRYTGEEDGDRGIMTVTQKDCMVSSFAYLGNKSGAKQIGYGSMTEVDLDYDESVFNKPEGCHDVSESRARRSAVGGVLESLERVINFI